MESKATQTNDLTGALGRAWGSSAQDSSVAPRSARRGLWRPLADIKETPSELVIFADLPGVDEDTVTISTDNRTICISGKRDFNHDLEDAEEFIRIERIYGPYILEVPLPDDADAAGVTARYTRGVLKVRVPRRKATRNDSSSPRL